MNYPGTRLRVTSPLNVFLAGGLGYFLLWLIAPIDFVATGGVYAFGLLLAYIFVFSVGLAAGFRRWRGGQVEFLMDVVKLNRLISGVAWLGLIGMVVRIYERVVLRAGSQISLDFISNRELIGEGGSAALAYIGSLLGPLLMFIPFLVMLSRHAGARSARHFWLLLLSSSYPLFDLVLMGSRSTLLIYLGIIFASAQMIQAVKIRPGRALAAVGAIVAIGWLSGYIFWIRTLQMGIDPVTTMYTSVYSAFAPVNDAALAALNRSGIDGVGGLLFGYVHFCQYMLHGVYEFLYVAGHQTGVSTNGLQSFYIPVKSVVTLLGAGNVEEWITSGVLRSGVYTTLFGPILYDFGPYGGLIASFVYGFGAGEIARRLRRGKVFYFPLFIVVVGFLPFAFVLNMFTSGTGQFLMLGSLLLMAITSSRRFRFYATVGAGDSESRSAAGKLHGVGDI